MSLTLTPLSEAPALRELAAVPGASVYYGLDLGTFRRAKVYGRDTYHFPCRYACGAVLMEAAGSAESMEAYVEYGQTHDCPSCRHGGRCRRAEPTVRNLDGSEVWLHTGAPR